MTEDELAGIIAERVMRILSEKNAERRSGGTKRLLVMTGRAGALEAAAAKALEEKFICTWQDRREAYAQELTAEDFDVLLVTELSNGQLASAALGVPYGAEARPIVEALCAGRPVFISEEGILFRQNGCASSELGKIYGEYLKRLYSFGAAPVSKENIPLLDGALGQISQKAQESVPAASVRVEDGVRVLTEQAVKELLAHASERASLLVPQRTIITPLANDFIIHSGAEVKRI